MAASPFFVDPEGNASPELLSKNRGVSVRDVSMRAPPPTTAVAVNTRPNFTTPGAPPAAPVQPAAPAAPPVDPKLAGMRAAAAGATDAVEPLSAGGKVMRGVANVGKWVGRAAQPAHAALGAVDAMGTPTSDYYNRMGLDPKTEGLNGFKDLGVRAIGTMSDVGASVLDGPMGLINGALKFGGAKPLQTFGEILRQNDNPAPRTPNPGLPPSAPAGPLMGTNGPQLPPEAARNESLAAPANRVSVVGPAPDLAGINERTSKIYADMRDIQGRLDAYGPGGQGGGGAAGIDGARAARETNAATDKSQMMDDIKRMANSGGRGAAAAISALASMRANSDNSASAERIAGMREQGDSVRANAQNATTMRGQDALAANNRLDNETRRLGDELSAKTAASTALSKKFNDDRAYGMDEKKLTQAQEDKEFSRRQASAEALHKEIMNQIQPGPDGKPDAAKAAQIATGLSTAMQQRKTALEKHLQKNPKDAQAMSELEGINREGVGALDATAKRRLIQGMNLKSLAEQNDSWAINPFGGTAVQSDAPVDSLKLEEHWYGNKYRTNRGDVIPASEVDKLNGMRNTNSDFMKVR